MVDEVEIKNVGGKFGVASEATLQMLLDAVSRDNPTRRRMEQVIERSQRGLDRSTRTLTERQGILSKSMGAATEAASLLGKELVESSTRLTDLVESIIGSGNLLTQSIVTVMNAIDNSVDRFRELSSVGASFNNSIFDMVAAAQNSYLSLDEFGRLIMENSQTLRLLGGGVTAGAKRFGELNRQLRTSEFGTQLFNMGYTFQEVNDTLMSYLDLSARDLRQRILTDQQLLAGTEQYVTELERLIKITGMSRKQAQDAMNSQMQDIRIRAAMANMTEEERIRFQNNMAAASAVSGQFGNVMADLSDGLPTDDVTAAFMAMFPEVERLAAEMENMDPYEFNNRMAMLGDEMGRFAAANPQLIQGLIQSGHPLAQLFTDMAGPMSDLNIINEETRERLERERLAQERMTSTFANFENAWNNFMKYITSGFTNSPAFTALGDLGAAFLGLTSESTEGSVPWLMQEINRFTDDFFGPTGIITLGLRDLTAYLNDDSNREAVRNFFEVLRDTANNIVEFFFGRRTTTGDPIDGRVTERVGGLFEHIYNEFDAVFKGEKTVLDVIYEGFVDTFTWLMDKLNNTIGPILSDWFFGPDIPDGPKGEEELGNRYGGFLQTITDGFWQVIETLKDQFVNFWEGPNGIEMRNTISGFFEDLVNHITSSLTGSGQQAAPSISSGEGMGTGILSQGIYSMTGGWLGSGNRVGRLDADAFLEQAEDWFADRSSYSLIGNSREEIETRARDWIQQTLDHLMSPAGGGLSRDDAKRQILDGLMNFISTPGNYDAEQFETMRNYFSDVVISRLNSFATGTSGFQDFGNESVAALHGVEAVVPRNTPAGDFLDRYFTDDWQVKNQAVQPTTDNRNNTSQENLVKYLIQLNSTMVSILSEIKRTNELEKQSLNSLRGLGGDMFRSV